MEESGAYAALAAFAARRRRRVRWQRLAAPLGAAILCGCSTATLTAGADLAKSGQMAAGQMEQNASLSADTLTVLRREVAFNDGYNNQNGNEDSKEFLTHMASVQGKLKQYALLLSSLAGAYGALGDLASYDAAGSFNTSIRALAGDTQTFASSVNAPLAIPTEASQGVAVMGGLAIGQLQARRVKAANDELETILKQVIAILDRPATRAQLVMAQDQVTGQIDQASGVLLLNGVYGYSAIADQLGAPLGLKSNDQTEAAVAADTPQMARVRAGFRAVAVEIAAEQPARAAESYDASLKMLKALVPMHEKLRNGTPLDLSQVASATAELKTIAASLTTPPSASMKGN